MRQRRACMLVFLCLCLRDAASCAHTAHPELKEAIHFALREVAIARPPNAVQYLAAKLLEFDAGRAKPSEFKAAKCAPGSALCVSSRGPAS